MNSTNWLSPYSQRSSSYFNFPVMELWNSLTRAVMTSVGAPATDRVTNQPQRASAIKNEPLPMSQQEVEALYGGSLKYKYGYRTLDSAAVVLRIARIRDPRLRSEGAKLNEFYDLLSKSSSYEFSTQSFAGKTVVAVEGLEGSGKSTVIEKIARFCPDLQIISRDRIFSSNDVIALFASMPEPVSKAFDFAVNYIMAYKILESPHTAFMVENYQHAVCAQNICEKVHSETAIAELSVSAFEWPYELPLPVLVLFLSISTPERLRRMQAGAVEDAEKMAVQAAKDARSNMVYSMVRGPGTVGLDASLPADEVTYTALEALEYYGVYAISRTYDPTYTPPPAEPVVIDARASASGDAMQRAMSTPGGRDSIDNFLGALDEMAALSPLAELTNRRVTAAQKSKQKRRSSLCYRRSIVKKLSGKDFGEEFGEENFENVNPQMIPELPEDTIKNRRISMGVYGMFTKL